MNRSLVSPALAAALVIGAVVGCDTLGGPISETPEPTATPAATPEATPEATPHLGLPLGAYTLATADGFEVEMTVTIPADRWYAGDDGILMKNNNAYPPEGAGLIVFTGADIEVYGDACEWESTRPDPITGPTVDDFITALAAQTPRDASVPTDVTVGGYAGQSILLSVPTEISFADCGGSFRSWGPPPNDRYHQASGQIDQVWVLDVDGTRVVVDAAWYAGTPDDVQAELQAIVESLRFD